MVLPVGGARKTRHASLKQVGVAISELLVILGGFGSLGLATAIGLYAFAKTGSDRSTLALWSLAAAALLVVVVGPFVVVLRCLASQGKHRGDARKESC